MDHLPTALQVQIVTAIASLIVVPFVVHLIRQFFKHRREARHAEMCRHFVGIDDFKEETETNKERHAENVKLLDAIRMEVHQSEARILSTIENIAKVSRDDVREVRAAVATVHIRVDNVLELQGDRRRRRD